MNDNTARVIAASVLGQLAAPGVADRIADVIIEATRDQRAADADIARRMAECCGRAGCRCNDGHHIALAIEKGGLA